MITALKFRNIDASPDDPVETWPFEGILAAVERGTLPDWRRLAAAIRADPWGPVAQQVLEAIRLSHPYGTAELLEGVVTRARELAIDSEREEVASEVRDIVARSGLSRQDFAERIGTSRSRLSTYMSGKVVPSATLVVRMRRAAHHASEMLVRGLSGPPQTWRGAKRGSHSKCGGSHDARSGPALGMRAATCTTLAPDVAGCPASTRCYGIDSTNPFSEPDISVLRSADGGAGWQQVGPNWSASVLNDIACPTTLTCYLAGTHGSVARITNGTTLTAQSSPATRELYGIGCAGPCACYAVGDNGTIIALR